MLAHQRLRLRRPAFLRRLDRQLDLLLGARELRVGAGLVIDQVGFRGAYIAAGVGTLLTAVPLYANVRRRPVPAGRRPARPQGTNTARTQLSSFSLKMR